MVWDGPRLRRITITTEAASPHIALVVDYTTIASYAGGGEWLDAEYDESSGTTYYVGPGPAVHRAKPSNADFTYPFPGMTLSGFVRIALTPTNLLVLQPSNSRVLSVPR